MRRAVRYGASASWLQVSLDAYKLLGISTVASRDSITKAYERVVDPQDAVYCEVGRFLLCFKSRREQPVKHCKISQFSGVKFIQDLLFSRAVVLKAAADTLLDSSSRRGFDQSGMLDIPEADLPGPAP